MPRKTNNLQITYPRNRIKEDSKWALVSLYCETKVHMFEGNDYTSTKEVDTKMGKPYFLPQGVESL